MTAEPLELLERVRQGDPAATEQLVVAYEPYLRLVVHRSLPDGARRRFDSVDVVQSVWVHALPVLREGGHFANGEHLRAFLAKIARRRLLTRLRRHLPAAAREQPGAVNLDTLPAADAPRPSEMAQAAELWEKMLALSPPEHHELLRLRRQGLPLEAIARRTGLHEGSVRRILRQLARRLALRACAPVHATGQVAAES